ncbi:MAG: class I SAM-dependent methyltransferase [Patescibacteria group bacterium]
MQINTNTNNKFSGNQNFDYGGEDLDLLEHADNYFNLIINNFGNKIGKSILEVGAGSGNLTFWLRKRFPDARIVAIEPSDKMFGELNSKNLNNVEVYQGFLSEYLDKFGDQFDTIIYNNVLEHIEDDVAEIKTVNSILKKDGYLLSYNPALNFLYDVHDASVGHYRRYYKKELVGKYIESGFVVESAKYHDLLGAVLMFVKYKVLKLKSIDQGSAMTYFNQVLPIVDKVEKFLPIPAGKNLFVIGKKK